jgi:hypothetical protein
MDKKLILSLALSGLGIFLICSYSNTATFMGVFALLWANNIGIMQNIDNAQRKEKSILKILFGNNVEENKVSEIMSQNMKISDK